MHRRLLLVFLLVLLLVGMTHCGGRTAGYNWSVPPADAGASHADAASAQCEAEQYLRLVAVPLRELYLMDPPSVAAGQTLRVAAGVEVGGCSWLAHVGVVASDDDQRLITVQAYLWEEVGPAVTCAADVGYQEELLPFMTMLHGEWMVRDAMAGESGFEVTYLVVGCWAGDCACVNSGPGETPAGSYCDYDCDCAGALRCLSRPAGVGDRECARSCSDESQCSPWETCSLVDGALYGHCTDSPADECTPGSCPAGFLCTQDSDVANHCEAAHDLSGLGQSCLCHAECAPGLWCTELDVPGPHSCQIPCRGQADCPTGVTCLSGSPPSSPICAGF